MKEPIMTRENHLDEMQELALLHIESRCFWLLWSSLLLALLVQAVLGAGLAQLAGEWAAFLAVSANLVAACLRHGIWDRRLRPTRRANALFSVLAGAVMGAVAFFRFGSWVGAAIAAACTCLLCFAALALCGALYRRQTRRLEQEDETR